ncbi:TAP domain protein [Stagonosporopsis vannaccii]|nr:TAP domain protein [Stagonosporopsis vannaccii]
MSSRRSLTIATLIALSSAIPTPSLSHNDPLTAINTSLSISWNACPPELPGAAKLQCASFSVPVDWSEPHGEHFDLGLVKLPRAALNSTFQKVGNLFVNPGEPDGSSTQFVGALALGVIKSDYLLGSIDIVQSLWFNLLANASTVPIPAPTRNNTNCYSNVTDEDIRFNAHRYLTFARDIGLGTSWDSLASALYNASRGDASALSTSLTEPSAWSFLAIGCSDWAEKASSSLSEILTLQTMAKGYAPLTEGATQQWTLQHGRLGWPVKTLNSPEKLNVKTKTPILLTQSTADPSTGLPWALGMLEEIKNKVLVLRKGDGHTSLPLGGKTADTIVEYLVTGKPPSSGLLLDS